MKTPADPPAAHFAVAFPLPQPLDAPLLTFETAAAYLGITATAIRALLKGTHRGDRELADMLTSALVVVSPHRRYIRKADLLAYLDRKAARPA